MGNHPPKLSEEDKMKLEKGEPVMMGSGIKITKNPKTGKLEGVPKEWVDSYDLPMDIDTGKTVKTKHFSEEIRPEEELPESILDFINQQPVYISKYLAYKLGRQISSIKCISRLI